MSILVLFAMPNKTDDQIRDEIARLEAAAASLRQQLENRKCRLDRERHRDARDKRVGALAEIYWAVVRFRSVDPRGHHNSYPRDGVMGKNYVQTRTAFLKYESIRRDQRLRQERRWLRDQNLDPDVFGVGHRWWDYENLQRDAHVAQGEWLEHLTTATVND